MMTMCLFSLTSNSSGTKRILQLACCFASLIENIKLQTGYFKSIKMLHKIYTLTCAVQR